MTAEDVKRVIRKRDLKGFKELNANPEMDFDTSLNHHGETAIFIAIRYGAIDILEYLIAEGIDIDCLNEDDQTPIIIASIYGKLDEVLFLKKHGADVTKSDKKELTALDYAERGPYPHILKELKK